MQAKENGMPLARRRAAGRGFGFLLAVIALAWPGGAFANHSLPAAQGLIPIWWDKDDDQVVDATDGDIGYCSTGTGWTQTAKDRLSEATAAWRNSSDWDPTIGSSQCGHYVHKDGSVPNPPGDTWAEMDPPNPLAVTQTTCTVRNPGTPQAFCDIGDVNVWVNWNNHDFSLSQNCTGIQCSTLFSLRGVLTHEIGHGIFLLDLYGTADCDTGSQTHTMCGAVSEAQSWFQDDLTSDDISSANAVY